LRSAGADEGALEEAHGGRFEGLFRSKYSRRTQQRNCTGP
jgi:hypothetical protein